MPYYENSHHLRYSIPTSIPINSSSTAWSQPDSPPPQPIILSKTLISIDTSYAILKQLFFVRATGDAMQDAGIFNNDLLIVDRSKSPLDQETVVVMTAEGFLVRRYVRKNGVAKLIADPSKAETIELKLIGYHDMGSGDICNS